MHTVCITWCSFPTVLSSAIRTGKMTREGFIKINRDIQFHCPKALSVRINFILTSDSHNVAARQDQCRRFSML